MKIKGIFLAAYVLVGTSTAFAAEQSSIQPDSSDAVAKDVLFGPVSRTTFRWSASSLNDGDHARASNQIFSEKSGETRALAVRSSESETVAPATTTARQSIYKWGIRSSAEQSIYKWGIRSAAEQSIYKWGIRSSAEQSIYKWGIRSSAEQSIYKWGIRSSADQSIYKWGIR